MDTRGPAQGHAALDHTVSPCCIPPPHLTAKGPALTGDGALSLLCQFFFVIFCFLLVFLLLSLFLLFFLFFIFLFLAAPGHLLLLQNKGGKTNPPLSAEADTSQHLGQPKQTRPNNARERAAKRKARCRQRGQAGRLQRPQGPKAFQGAQR